MGICHFRSICKVNGPNSIIHAGNHAEGIYVAESDTSWYVLSPDDRITHYKKRSGQLDLGEIGFMSIEF